MKRVLLIWRMQWKDKDDIKSSNSIQLCKEALNSLISQNQAYPYLKSTPPREENV